MWKRWMLLPLLAALFVLSAIGAEAAELPAHLTEIGEEAFLGDISLDDVVIPDWVETIGARAFYGSSARRFYLPDSVSSIGEDAFPSSAVLYAAPGSLTEATAQEAGYPVFDEDIDLDDFSFYTNVKDPSTCYIMSYTGTKKNITLPSTDKQGRKVVNVYRVSRTVESVIIPEGVTVIDHEAFGGLGENTNLKYVSLPSTLEHIKSDAFQRCTALETIKLPDSLISIGSNAFENCRNLRTVSFNSGLREIGNDAFFGCTGLTELTIPSSVITIGNSCFGRCTGLAALSFSEESCLQAIGQTAFSGCTSLEEVALPDTLTEIPYALFNDCTSLRSVSLPAAAVSIGGQSFEKTALRELSLPAGVGSIGAYAFNSCKSLESVTIYDCVHEIEHDAFANCSELRTFETLVSGNVCTTMGGVGQYAFGSCEKLTSLSLPPNFTSLGKNVFFCCGNLTSVVIPYGVTTLESENLFDHCSSLTAIYVPDTVSEIAERRDSYSILGAGTLNLTVYGSRGSFIERYVDAKNAFLAEHNWYTARFQPFSYHDTEAGAYKIIPMHPFVGVVGSSYTHTVAFTDGVLRDSFTLSSDNTDVAISRGKQIELVGLGGAGITIHCGSLSSEYMVYGAMNLESDEMTVIPGKEKTIELKFYTDPAYQLFTQQLEWSSSDTGVCRVDADGTIHGVKEGQAQITARLPYAVENVPTESTPYLLASCLVTVKKPTPFTLSAESWNLGIGEGVLVYPAGTGKYSYTSSDTKVAYFNGNRLTGRSEGKATVTVTSREDGYSATHTVYVHGNGFKYKLVKDGYSDAKHKTRPKMETVFSIAEGQQSKLVKTVEDRVKDYIAIESGFPKDAEAKFYELMNKKIESMKTSVNRYNEAATEKELIKMIFDDLDVKNKGEFSFQATGGTYVCRFELDMSLWSASLSIGSIQSPVNNKKYAFGSAFSSPKGLTAEMNALRDLAEAKIGEARQAVFKGAVDELLPTKAKAWLADYMATGAYQSLKAQSAEKSAFLALAKDCLEELSDLNPATWFLFFDFQGDNETTTIEKAATYSTHVSEYLSELENLKL